MKNNDFLSEDSIAIRQQMDRTQYNEHSAPVFLTSSFVFETAEAMQAAFNEETEDYIYSRYSNPNVNEFVKKVCSLENAPAGIATASGMAAVYDTFMALLKSGDHIISCASVFGATHTILNKYFPKIGISYSYFDANLLDDIYSLIRPETKLIYLETPTNPAISVLDLEKVGQIARENNLLLVVDNCFATPIIQKPMDYGADLVIHSATKYMDGQGRVLGGVVVGREELIREIYLFNRITGASMSSFNAWVLSKSLETLSLRVERHSSNALYIAEKLLNHPALESVNYPFLSSHPQYNIAIKQMKWGGGILAIQVQGGEANAKIFLNELKMILISPNLGDSRTIATHPSSSTHCKLMEEERLKVGITQNLVRISVGLEGKEDILNDILMALQKTLNA